MSKSEWTKLVTVNPPNYISFEKNDSEEFPLGFINIKNQSTFIIMFKVKTT